VTLEDGRTLGVIEHDTGDGSLGIDHVGEHRSGAREQPQRLNRRRRVSTGAQSSRSRFGPAAPLTRARGPRLDM
jgi:hypothetical protein